MFNVVRKSWGKDKIVGTFPSKEAAEVDRDLWEEATLREFKEGRIMYDIPEFSVEEAV